jgi:hypothetical protein
MCDKSKRSKTISIIIRNHQYDVDGKGYRITIYGDSNIRYQSLSGPMRQSDTIDYRSFTQTTLRDSISETNRDALEKLQMILIAQEEEYSTHEEVTNSYVEVKTTSTEPESKPKSNKRKWLFGLGASTVLAGMITYVFKNK